ncbi:MAG: 2-oxoacid:acceptor oxidoreductase subunit alpha [candidate division WOR-3 bacterium]|nr:2-oxoacid:acceptor oxidoreductase subunit alpha [candidate division WOR-3 bacterium]
MAKPNISIVIIGEAGQGINSVGEILVKVVQSYGLYAFAWTELMSRIRGGLNSTQIIISNQRARAPLQRIDLLVPLKEKGVYHHHEQFTNETMILSEFPVNNYNSYQIPYLKKAREIGDPIFANIIAAGLLIGLVNIPFEYLKKFIVRQFKTKGENVINSNIIAAEFGFNSAISIKKMYPEKFNGIPNDDVSKEKVIDGSTAIALGAIAGGVKFLAAYPMTPSSGVWTYLARVGNELDIITEQAEDEISAMNMGLGASYAGARAMVTTSGGGFDLMTEGLSLAGIQETPIVVHLAQRPGPATGLPTRTEQADLELALYAGHGEFPRIIFAPGNYEQGFYLTALAFDWTERFQTPVFVLTDQFFIDSLYSVKPFDLSRIKISNYVVETQEDYERYKLNETGISPRGIPGYGRGFVHGDCHHHDENGHISEDLKLRTKMVDKLMNKYRAINSELIEPELVGTPDYELLVLCWGSNYEIVKEAIRLINSKNISMLHFSQVYPIHPVTYQYLKKARKLCMVENNATGQMAKLLKLTFGINIENLILKYNGLPFSVEEVANRIGNLI